MHVYHTSISSLFVYTYKCFSFNKAYKKRKLAKQLKNISARVLDKNILGYTVSYWVSKRTKFRADASSIVKVA